MNVNGSSGVFEDRRKEFSYKAKASVMKREYASLAHRLRAGQYRTHL